MTGNDKADTARRVKRTAEILRIAELLGRKPRQLSGGQRQRVAIGRAIMREPQLFLFDEPLSNLDAELRVQMRVELARLHKELGVTMIYVTHDQTEAMTLADRIVVLRDGLSSRSAAPLDLYNDPDNQFRRWLRWLAEDELHPRPCRRSEMKKASSSNLQGRAGRASRSRFRVRLRNPAARSIVGVRPEHFGDAGKGDADLTVSVDVVEHLGGTSFRLCHAPPQAMNLSSSATPKLVDPTEMTVSIRKSYLFDEKGLRLR